MNWRDDSPGLGSCSLRSTSNTLCTPTEGFAKVEERGSDGANPGGDHFPGAGAPRGGVKEADGFGPSPRLGVRKTCGFCLRGAGLLLSISTGGFCGSGLAHFEIGGAHFPIPAGVDVVSGDGGAVGLLLEKPHPVGCALTCAKRRVSV